MATKTEGKVFGTMNARRISRLLGVTLAGFVAVGASNCADQREPECTVAPFANYGVKLTPVGSPTGTNCDVDEGDDLFSVGFKNPSAVRIGLRPFVVLGSDRYPDYDIPQRVALQLADMGSLQARAEGAVDNFTPNVPNPVYAYGRFATPRPSNDLCGVVEIADAQLAVPAIAIALPSDPDDFPVDDPKTEDADESRDFSAIVQASGAGDTNVTAAWSNMRVLVSTAYPGTQFEATLVYTYEVAEHETFDLDERNNPIFLEIGPDGLPILEPGPDGVLIPKRDIFVAGADLPGNEDGSTPFVDAMGNPVRVPDEKGKLVPISLANLTPKSKAAAAYSCTRTYQALGVFGGNSVQCAGDDGGPDQTLCTPDATGASPDFPLTCDPDSLLCVLNGPFLTGKRQ